MNKLAQGQRSRQRGVSLIEAVVAMAIMGFGMLGVLGLQASLRSNADVSKQRSEAVRIAQAQIEADRGFSVLAPAPGAFAYDQIASAPATDVVRPNANTTFSLQTLVSDLPASANRLTSAPNKQLLVNVQWSDRNGEVQRVRLSTVISPVAPELTAALSMPADTSPVQRISGRNPTIPVSAVDLGNGTSRFTPPGAATGVSWIFNNTTGFITQSCVFSTCTDFLARLLTGFVNFSTGLTAPTSADAETPSGGALINASGQIVEVSVDVTEPASDTINCFELGSSTYVTYYCAMPVTLSTTYWTGRARLVLPSSFDIVSNISDNDDDEYRVCRYTRASARVLPHVTVPTIRNEDHPRDYYRVANTLIGQNYLVIRAGNGSGTAFTCPADDSSTPEIDGSTWHHQPGS